MLFGASPFGVSATVSKHTSTKTTWQFSVGGAPKTAFDVPVNGVNYSMDTESLWVGCFVNHRPFVERDWFRLVTGIAIGTIENSLRDSQGNRFLAEYRESPVAYMGFGFGVTTRPGITLGLDIGWLQSAGARISYQGGSLSPDEQRARMEAISDDFFFGSFLPNIQLGLGYNL